ncbi:MAG: ABC transporter permease subunit [Synergistaceae bacterium]|nr:ABC transporter permease subunit [Synergistaceae bacterium]MBQ9628154.1 ABC transporter permease subunit [Synergistaceae bacterium]MBR0250217.1 ABC transporter permease subunit [Synergistaceae bacterium]
MRRLILNFISAVLILGIGLLYYYATENNLVNPFLFPKVSAIIKAFSKNQDIMLLNLLSSLGMMIPSIIISLAIALTLGIILGRNAILREILHPILYIFSVVPSILLSPFVLLLAPDFWTASVFLIVYSTVWSTLFATVTGIMTIDKRYLDKADVLELRGMKRITKVILPAASPSILSGFVNSLRNTFVMLVYAEMYGSRYGMGFFVKKYTDFSLYDYAWGGFLFMVMVLVIVMQFFDRLKEYLLRWTID